MPKQIYRKEELPLIVGQKIGRMICSFYHVFGDIVAVWGMQGGCQVFTTQSIRQEQPTAYSIEGEEVRDVFLPKNHRILILKTANQSYIRDYDNLPISDAENWQDYYSDPLTGGFFRQDVRGIWHDIEGNKMESPVFLQEEVLISLPGKTSRKSFLFRGQQLKISPGGDLIQIGKLVYDLQLQLVQYYGEKITGVGAKYISFGPQDSVQEVHLGLHQSAFLLTANLKPYRINQEQIIAHVESVQKGGRRFEVFRSKDHEYVVDVDSQEVLTCDGHLVTLNFDTYLSLENQELVQCSHGNHTHFMDLNARATFFLPGVEETPVTHIDRHSISLHGKKVRNVITGEKRFVYREADKSIFTLDGGSIIPQAVHEVEHLSRFYALADLGEEQILFYKKTGQTLNFPEEEIRVQKITGKATEKLFNAESSTGEKIVLDARHGLDKLRLAFSGRQAVVEVFGQTANAGSAVLQNALLKTLGGAEKRVIDLNKEDLAVLLLPEDLTTFPQDIHPSIYLGNPVVELDLEESIQVEQEVFYRGFFLPYHETPTPILIQQKNKRPLHLEGAGHRNELVTALVPDTLANTYPLGTHRMIGAYTLSEDGKENQLLFSINKQKSWLAFGDDFLPIMEKVAQFENTTDWEYLLYQLRDAEENAQYLVVEKAAPHRILAERKKGKEIPKLIEFTVNLEEPEEETSFIQRFFGKKKGFLKKL